MIAIVNKLLNQLLNRFFLAQAMGPIWATGGGDIGELDGVVVVIGLDQS